ncbi:transposase, partial [Enterococcus faecium]|nr:transposase [Enterococcus faecium]
TTIIHLFEKGVTMSEIADLIEKMYGHHYTPQTMSNMTKVLTDGMATVFLTNFIRCRTSFRMLFRLSLTMSLLGCDDLRQELTVK